MHTYGIQKDGPDEPTCRGAMENRLTDMAAAGQGRRRGWEVWRVTWKHILLYVKQILAYVRQTLPYVKQILPYIK